MTYDDLLSDLYSALAEERERQGLTLTEQAQRLGLSRSLLGHYISGRRRPSLEVATALASSVGMEVQLDLVQQGAEAQVARWAALGAKMPPAKRDLVSRLIALLPSLDPQLVYTLELQMAGWERRGADLRDHDAQH